MYTVTTNIVVDIIVSPTREEKEIEGINISNKYSWPLSKSGVTLRIIYKSALRIHGFSASVDSTNHRSFSTVVITFEEHPCISGPMQFNAHCLRVYSN